MPIKTSDRHDYTPDRIANIKEVASSKALKGADAASLVHRWWDCNIV